MFEESVSNSSSIWASMNSWFTPTVLFVLLNLMIGTILFSSNLSTTPQQQNQETKQEKQQDHQEESTNIQPQQNDQSTPTLQKSPSVLQRLKSINFKSFTEGLDSDTTEQHLNQELQSAIETQTHYLFDDHQTLIAQAQFVFQEAHHESGPLTQPHESEAQIQQPHESEATELQDVVPQSLDEVYSHFAELTDSHFSRTTSDTKPASGEIPAKLSTKMKKSASMKSPFAHFEEDDIVEARRPVTVRERGAKVTDVDEEVDAKADDFINKFKQQLKLQRVDSIMRYKEVINRGAK
ncbi:Alkaline phytoceramidase (APHC) [Heracleum sosnowskyi]|uniref:Alkaline phytoceramidase (APHC) n=1 Tax=Heracleum sosnowskyi TaxID=360622 RepID=A0AAD8HKF5_9APIA|nr:Alkaline phytoceramidase (APHC) [Heracleum sosnowskyi]